MKRGMRHFLTSATFMFLCGMLSACGKEDSESQVASAPQEVETVKEGYVCC